MSKFKFDMSKFMWSVHVQHNSLLHYGCMVSITTCPKMHPRHLDSSQCTLDSISAYHCFQLWSASTIIVAAKQNFQEKKKMIVDGWKIFLVCNGDKLVCPICDDAVAKEQNLHGANYANQSSRKVYLSLTKSSNCSRCSGYINEQVFATA